MKTPHSPRHLLTLDDWSTDEIEQVLVIAGEFKYKAALGERTAPLSGRMLCQIYDKPSLRTRVSFESAMACLGGNSTFMSSREAGLLGRESLRDVAIVLSRCVDAIVIRTFSQQRIEDIAAAAKCPVINGLSDDRHPCQALADMLTINEAFGSLAGLKFVFVGDGNNVAKSLAVASGKLGVSMTLCAPNEFTFDQKFRAWLGEIVPDLDLSITDNLEEALAEADVIYTDVWTSMGQESEHEARRKVFAPYQINEAALGLAPKSARFLHCLPAHRGEEVTDAVIDGPQSLIYDQAENRMHLARGLLTMLVE